MRGENGGQGTALSCVIGRTLLGGTLRSCLPDHGYRAADNGYEPWLFGAGLGRVSRCACDCMVLNSGGSSRTPRFALQIIWRQQANGGNVLWSRYTWRRGSAPLWWGVSLRNNGIGEAEIRIRQHSTFKGSKRWVPAVGYPCLQARPGRNGCWL